MTNGEQTYTELEEAQLSDEKTYTEQEAHRFFAGNINGEVWGLLGKDDRTAEEDQLMIHAAHASLFHWLKVGTGVHHQRGAWLIARVYSELGLAKAAMRYAELCQDLTKQHADSLEDFDRAYAYECMARANAVAGNREQAKRFKALAQEAGEAIADDESKEYFLGDLQGGNWGDFE